MPEYPETFSRGRTAQVVLVSQVGGQKAALIGFPMYRRNSEAADRMRERRRIEDAAPRLAEEVPLLKTLRLTLSFRRGDVRIGDASYVRVVVVPTAPALFTVPCSDPNCRDGGHPITTAMLKALRSGVAEFSGEEPCQGSAGTSGGPCGCTLRYKAEATYQKT